MKQALLIAVVSLSLAFTASSAYADKHDGQQREMKADANGDGKVSFEEFKAAHMARIEARFKRKDINQDGFIDASDIKVIKKERHAKKQAKREDDKKALREKYIEEKKKRKKHFYKY
jgi:hypothetical protein